jgi:hydroxylysine kinase
VRGLLDHIPDPQQRGLARRFLDSFERHAQPVLNQLRAQVIHNDLNPHNVLVCAQNPDRIAGIIDFGDMVQAPLVNDLAVAAAYHPTQAGHALAAMADLVAGYDAEQPLEDEELALLYDLIAARMVVSVAISGWRAARHPENRDYILRNNRLAWIGLQSLASISRAQAQDFFRRLCRKD